MKTTKMLTILVLASAIMVWPAEVSEAAEMGTAFTYQGRLIDANDVADGLYDFQFSLYDVNVGGAAVANDVNVHDMDVIDGYFTVELDFDGEVFDGNAVWLEIGVRPGDSNDVNDFVTLSPRQEITPTPYALHTRWFLADTALDNVFAGEGAGTSNTTGNRNSAMGYQALNFNTTGYSNAAVGFQALYLNSTGYRNSAVGYRALYLNSTGYRNSAVGNFALNSNTTGTYNSAMGNRALYTNTIGNDNSAMGSQAGYNNSAGSRNVFIGHKAGYNETGSDRLYIANSDVDPPLIYGEFDTGNVGIGTTSPATKLEVDGTVNATAFVGDGSGLTGITTTETDPTVLASVKDGVSWGEVSAIPAGFADGVDDIGGPDSDWTISGIDMYPGAGVTGNVGIGTSSPGDKLDVDGNINSSESYKLDGQTVVSNTGTDNIFVGKDAGVSITTGNRNSAMGTSALRNNTTGRLNTAIGYEALTSNTTRNENTGVGYMALRNNTEGEYNSAVGSGALYANTTGKENTAIGRDALSSNTGGHYNSAMGYMALRSNTTGSRNSAMGNGALLSNTTGQYNSAMGTSALIYNTTGQYNSAMGTSALIYNTTGNYNVGVGSRANYWNQEGSRNTIIGYEAGQGTSAHNKSGNVFVGYKAGYNEIGDNKLYIANSDADPPLIYGDFSTGNLGIGTTTPATKLEVDGTITATGGTSDDWNTAYGWGDHSVAGYLTSLPGSVMVEGENVSLLNNDAGYLTAYSETDPIFTASSASAIQGTDITNWNIAYNWGDHAGAGYLTSYTETDPTVLASVKDGVSWGEVSAIPAGFADGIDNIGGPDSDWTISDSNMYSVPSGDVGIGTSSPGDKLDVDGHINSSESYKLDGDTVLSNTGTENIFVGKDAGVSNTTGYWNSAVGNYALYFNTEGSFNLAVGGAALLANDTGNYNSAVGYQALQSNTEGSANSAVGYWALYANTTGYDNSAMGNQALYSNTTGYDNSAMGNQALYSNTTGSENSAVGYWAGFNNSTGSGNVFVGYQAGYNETGSDKLYIANSDDDPPLIYGDFSTGRIGIGTTSPENKLDVEGAVAVGTSYSGTNTGPTNGMIIEGNVGIGTTSPSAKLDVITSDSNAVRGESSASEGRGVYGYASNTGDVNNYGGYFMAAGGTGRGVYSEATGGSGRGVYGYASNTGSYYNYGGFFVAKGVAGRGVYGRTEGINGRGVFGQATGISGIGVYGWGTDYDFYAGGPGANYGSTSSIRWKSDVRAIDDPLGKILRLRGVYFNWDAEHGGGHDVGMIAEEVGEVLPEIVNYEENGIDASGMDYSKVTPLLVEAVKALKIDVDEQLTEKDVIIERLQQENRALLKRVAAIESLVEQIAGEGKGLSNEAF